jgi:hypothetical protein
MSSLGLLHTFVPIYIPTFKNISLNSTKIKQQPWSKSSAYQSDLLAALLQTQGTIQCTITMIQRHLIRLRIELD